MLAARAHRLKRIWRFERTHPQLLIQRVRAAGGEHQQAVGREVVLPQLPEFVQRRMLPVIVIHLRRKEQSSPATCARKLELHSVLSPLGLVYSQRCSDREHRARSGATDPLCILIVGCCSP